MNVASTGSGPPVDIGVTGYENAVEVGRGGFAVVYRAWQPGFDRHVAIKVVSTNLDATAMSRFERECIAIGALSEHPNIVTVHELGWTKDGRPFIVMEFLAGGSLGARLDTRGPLDWREAIEVTIKIAGALESAHRAGVLHRDVKPENVLMSRYGDAKLGDFGIARIHGHSETMTSGITASWSHAPPELVNGKRPSVPSDIYALSSTLYTLIAGHAPFHRPEDEGLLPMLARIPTEPVPDLRPSGVPDALCRVIEQGMAKDPSDRQASAADFGRQLQDAQRHVDVPATALPLEIVDLAGKIRGELPSIDRPAADTDDSGPTRAAFSTFAAGAFPVPASDVPPPAAPAPVTADGPPPPAPVVPPRSVPVEPGPTGPRRGRWPIAIALVVVLAIAAGAVLLTRGGNETTAPPVTEPAGEPVPSTAAPTTTPPTTVPPTTVPPTTVALVRFTVSDELLPEDASEEVELVIDGGTPVRFMAAPAGMERRVPLTVTSAGVHSYRLVVTTVSRAGARATLTGSGTFDVQEGRHFEVALSGPATVCLSVDRICTS